MVSFIPYIKFSHSMFQIKAHVLINISAMVKNKLTILAEQIKILPVSSASS
jgi:hypothetical protein